MSHSTTDDRDRQTDEEKRDEAMAIAGGDRQVNVEVVETTTKSDAESDEELTHPSHPESGYPDAVGEDVEISIVQVDYTTRERGGREYPMLHIFGRQDTPDAPLEHIKVPDFRPYFYILDNNQVSLAEDDSRVTRTEPGYTTIRGEDVVRVYTENPGQVSDLREKFDSHYEADILFPNRFLIDKNINNGIRVPQRRTEPDTDGNTELIVKHDEVEAVDLSVTPRMSVFDIETEDRNGFPENGEEPILCITSYDNYDDEYVVWTRLPGTDADPDVPSAFPDYEAIGDDELNVRVNKFPTEVQMMEAFLDYIERTDPDILTGWNFEDFDAPYVLDRLDKLNDANRDADLWKGRLSRVGVAYSSSWGPTIKGRVVMDLLYAYKRTQFSEKESYRLDAIGESELGVGKEHYSGDLGDLWENDPKRLLEYNLRDVEICVELNDDQEIIPFWDEVRSFVGCLLEDAPTPSDTCDMYVLHKVQGDVGERPTFVLPSKGQAEYEDYEGGAVFDAISGVRELVTVLDLKSLYPMCMVTINASPETKVDPEVYEGDTFEAPNGVHFRKDQDGVIRSIIDELLSERETKKALRNDFDPGSSEYDKFDRQQGAVKVIMNSLYGVLGWERFRLYDKAMGAAVTATGRGVIEYTEKVVEENGLEVTYGDTDSVMLELKNIETTGTEFIPDEMRDAHSDMSEEELQTIVAALKRSQELEEIINDRYSEYAKEELGADEHRFQIEFEKLYRRFFQAGKKKRYAGHIVWKEGKHLDKVDVTGFESQRSDIAAITKEVQNNVIDMIVHGEDNQTIKDYVNDIIEDVLDGNMDLDTIGIPGGIGQKLENYDTRTAQVRGAQYANLLMGTNLGMGSKPKRLYLKKVHPDFWLDIEEELNIKNPQQDPLYAEFKRDPDVICYEYAQEVPDGFEIDWDIMLSKTLESPISRVLEPIGITWEDAKSGQTQTGLANFM